MTTLAELLDPVEVFIEGIVEDAKNLADKVWKEIKDLPMALVNKAIALVQETSLGTAILNLVSAASHATGASGEDKLKAVFDKILPAYEAFQEAGGFKGLIAIGVNILRALIEVAYATFKNVFSK